MKEITLTIHLKKKDKYKNFGPYSPIIIKQIAEIFGVKREESIVFTIEDASDYSEKLTELLVQILNDFDGEINRQFLGAIRCLSEMIIQLSSISPKNKLIKNLSFSYS